MPIYPQLINNLELKKAKLGAKMFDRSELIYYPSAYDNLHIVIMELEDTNPTTDRFLVTEMYLNKHADSKEELLEIALKNLRELPHNFVKMSDKPELIPDNVDGSQIYALSGVDGFESARILLPDVLDYYKCLSEDGTVFVITPSIDQCLIFLGEKNEIMARFFAYSIYKQSEQFALTPNVQKV